MSSLLETLILIGISLFTFTATLTIYLWVVAKKQGKSFTTYLDELVKNLEEQSENK